MAGSHRAWIGVLELTLFFCIGTAHRTHYFTYWAARHVIAYLVGFIMLGAACFLKKTIENQALKG
jgi:hypothetical protein